MSRRGLAQGRFLRSSASAQDLVKSRPAQLDDISHGQESLVALSGDSSSSDAEAAASLKGRFLRSSASAQDLLAAKARAARRHLARPGDLLAAKSPRSRRHLAGQESLVALSGDSPSSDAEAAASLKGRFLRSSASAQDLLAAKSPRSSTTSRRGQESLVANSGDSPSSDAEAAASLKGRFLRSSRSSLSGDSPSSDAEAVASLKDRFLRSSASAQDLVKSKEPVQLDKVAPRQESLFGGLGGGDSSSEVEATASLAPEADVRRLSVSKARAVSSADLRG
ncbi:N,N-dimethylaniline monooxygenase [Aureococcus anophagefferens]|nr:N,N-dimethylaniline monooxygenase [Aureococcus anophagefferens]